MTQETTTPLADRAARTAERLEEYSRADDGPIMQYLAATGTEATISGSGIVTDAWIVIQPSSPRVEFRPWGASIRVYDNGDDFTRAIFDGEAGDAVAAGGECLTLTFDSKEIEL